MKRKIFILSIPILLSILGIIYLQVDWMRKTYGLEFESINKLSDYALSNAVATVNKENIESAAITLSKIFPSSMGQATISWPKGCDSLVTSIYLPANYTVHNQLVNGDFSMGRIKFHLPDQLIADDDVHHLYQGLNKAMRGGSLLKILPTDSLRIVSYFKENLKDAKLEMMPNEMRIFFVKGEMGSEAFDSYKQKVAAYPHALRTGLKLYQPATLASFDAERIWVGAYFQNHQKQIMTRMMYGSILSMCLVVAMIICFLYLIGLLMKQKRIGEMKDDFISNLTHEFKTPISTISAAMEAMENFNALKDPVKTSRYLKVSRDELQRLDAMVTQVLDISSHENKTLELDIRPTPITKMIRNITENEKLRAEKTVAFEISVASEVEILNIDENHFRNVIVNLVDNAIKYSNNEVNIKIEVKKQKNLACFTVEDDGLGIAPTDLLLVFDKFFRVQKGNIYHAKGTGIGLSYVKSIVQLHNGEIRVKSELNIGTTFTIELPLG